MILLPDADGTISFHWVLVGSGLSERWEALVDDNGDTSYVQCDNDSAAMIIEFANPDDVTSANSGVAEAEIDTITSVRFISSGRSANRRNAALVDIEYQVPSGFSESCSYDPHVSSHETINGTARTGKPGGGLWQYSDLEALEMKCTKDGTNEVYLGYLAIEVTYTEVGAVADNATFFGANF